MRAALDMSDPAWLRDGAPHVWRPYCQHGTADPPLPVVAASGCHSRWSVPDLNVSDICADARASWVDAKPRTAGRYAAPVARVLLAPVFSIAHPGGATDPGHRSPGAKIGNGPLSRTWPFSIAAMTCRSHSTMAPSAA